MTETSGIGYAALRTRFAGPLRTEPRTPGFTKSHLATEPLRHERTGREMAQSRAHPLERRLCGRIAREVTLFFRVRAQVEQLLAKVARHGGYKTTPPSITAPSGQAFLGKPEESRLLGSFGTTSASAGSEDACALDAAADSSSQNRASEDPGNGEPASRPSTSTIVAARSPQTHRLL